jgi:hypothetical protein
MRKLQSFAWLAGAVAFFFATTAADAFTGRYAVKGATPDKTPYEGMAQIEQTGDTYTVLWKVGDIAYLGTAILNEGVLSVVFQPMNAPASVRTRPGLASFVVRDGHVIGGAWTGLGAQVVAQEKWIPAPGDKSGAK